MPAKKARIQKGTALNSSHIILAAAIIFIASYTLLPKFFKPSYPEMFFSLIFFLSSAYLIGYSFTKDVFKTEDSLELVSMRVAFGLSSMPLLFVLMETARVPLKWYVLLALSLVRPVYDTLMGGLKIRQNTKTKYDFYSSSATLLAVLAFSLALYGSFVFPYLEDGDSWEHAAGVKYISLSNTYTKPQGLYVAHYLKPYPPSYDVLMGLTHQLNSSVNWTLKAFNSLLVGFTYLFAFYFVRRISGDGKCALLSAAVLFMLPPFGSHAIWAHTLSALLVFPVFYAVENSRGSKSWSVLAAVFLASSLVVQPIMSVVMGIFYALYALANAYSGRKTLNRFIVVGEVALALSMVYWGPVFMNPSEKGELGSITSEILSGNLKVGVTDQQLPTAERVFFPRASGDIYMQQGFGLAAMLLLLLYLDHLMRLNPMKFARENPAVAAVTLWFLFSFAALFSGGLSVSFYPPRFWGITSIPLAILSGYMLTHIGDIKWLPKKAAKYAVPILIVGLLATSGAQKFLVQIMTWPTDLRRVIDYDFRDYYSLSELPANTLVYPYCVKDAYVIGFDKLSLPWDSQVVELRSDPVNAEPRQTYNVLKSRGYQWMLVDHGCVLRCMAETNRSMGDCQSAEDTMLSKLVQSKLFGVTYHSNTTYLKLR